MFAAGNLCLTASGNCSINRRNYYCIQTLTPADLLVHLYEKKKKKKLKALQERLAKC